MWKLSELTSTKFPQRFSRIPIRTQNRAQSSRSTKPSVIPLSSIKKQPLRNHEQGYPKSHIVLKVYRAVFAIKCYHNSSCITLPFFLGLQYISKSDRISASRWLRKLEQEFQIQNQHINKVKLADLLLAIDFLLTKAALEWVEENPVVFTTLTNLI